LQYSAEHFWHLFAKRKEEDRWL